MDAAPALEAEILFSLLEPTSSLVGGRVRDVSRAMVEAHLDRLLPGDEGWLLHRERAAPNAFDIMSGRQPPRRRAPDP